MKQKTKLISSIFILFTFFNSFGNENEIFTNNTPFQYEHILAPNDPNNKIYFGQSISISGNTLAVGATLPFSLEENPSGRAYIFENENNNWNQKAKLNINDGTNGDGFGTSISISNDIVVVGAPFANVSSNIKQGKAYIFKKNGNDWNQVAELIANDGEAGDYFGYSVFILGKIIIIGSPDANINGTRAQGCAYIFNGNEDGTIWNQTQKLIGNDGKESDNFGWSISVSNDIAIIGIPNADIGSNQNQGKTYIFQKNGTNWNQSQILIASDGQADENFGWSVSISSDSSCILIGAPQAYANEDIQQGKAYIFQKNGTNWNQSQILIANDGKLYDNFGFYVSISSNSSWIIIGAPYANVGGNNYQGKAYVFQNNGNYWNETQILTKNNGKVGDEFGTTVVISDTFAIIGSPGSDSSNGKYTESGNVVLINDISFIYISSSSSSKTTVIVCSTVIPVVFIVGVILTVFFIRKRRKRKQEQNSTGYSKLTQTN
ncbi:hypothetical protein M0811_06429 [Anaeramoeba ignava]|uniref:Uncharacterized protein n=1 Tax=Anaeramoeba ignava TaxID=1746090 RepID=A0A9Q0LPZ6_ANAIG|nr:hypothetical protein M0811_06429 [Anaeramoeba ignava]